MNGFFAEVMAEDDFGISKEACDKLYDCAGELIPEDADQITINSRWVGWGGGVFEEEQKTTNTHNN